MELKKLLMLGFASTLILTACGEEAADTSAEEPTDTESTEVAEDTDTDAGNDTDEEVTEDEPEEEEEEAVEESEREIVLGEPMQIGDYTMTITDYSLGTDYEGNDALIVTYDWENSSDESASPFMTFMLKGFQDNVETEDVFMVDGADIGAGQKEVRPEGKIEGAHTVVGINDLDQPLELELDVLISFTSDPYTTVLDLSTLQ
jgi:hypothetical protein